MLRFAPAGEGGPPGRRAVVPRVGQGRPDSTFLSVTTRSCADFEPVVDRTAKPYLLIVFESIAVTISYGVFFYCPDSTALNPHL
jgi:hypothetical protein